MPRVRNVADGPRIVPCVGVAVDVDEVFDVPQDVFDAHVWPEELFEVVDAGDGSDVQDGE